MDEISGLIIKMTEFFSGDPKRIQHFIKVHTFARVIGRADPLQTTLNYELECCMCLLRIADRLYIK